jgi:hypothetical protein
MKFKIDNNVTRGNLGNQTRVEVTYKINIYNFKVTLVTLVTSIITLAHVRIKNIGTHKICSDVPPQCKIEVAEVTEVTRRLMLAFFRLPLHYTGYLWLPLPFKLEAFYE